MRTAIVVALLALAACGDTAKLSVEDGTGTDPKLPEPVQTLLPTVNIADAKPWAAGETPVAAEGYSVALFAEGLAHPRWIYRLPGGDILVAESNKPPRPVKGLMGRIEAYIMGKAGAGAPSADRITLLRDADGDGVVDTRGPFLAEGLGSPFGMALVGDRFYVGNYADVRAWPYTEGATSLTGVGTRLIDLPRKGESTGHWTRNLLASADSSKLYVAVGSVSNVAEGGMAVEEGRAAIHEIDLATGASRLFATGLRNPVGMDWNPVTGQLWTAVNERDALGSDLVPDYMTSVKDGGFYGWPYSYYGGNVDTRPDPKRPDLVAKAIKPDYALGAHTASLGLAFAPDGSGAYVGQHGSWNRKPHSGYKVIFVPFAGGKPAGMPRDILTGFLVGDHAKGRPVGVAFDRTGALLVADDVGGRVWRVTGPGLGNGLKSLEPAAEPAIAPE
ncbi:PQQ-dependent sugar dehydrogenase [Sphingosinicella soli]|uniref:Glucose/arabinose dehydrogenase n=1 Tax=Sphingosinicella soli TaxID=333708 RepID=A0A7W7F848_9SPHN|nr:sorbosone dehydrogenase family protein [Sphingosinicella soli]MBB4631253.1 glucose/arabinose dehydrogenase [Sphingosinicella soli]